MRDIIVILGMHRSGTSALARMLGSNGVAFGQNLLSDSVDDNANGYWEQREIVELQESLLDRYLDRTWHGPKGMMPYPDEWWRGDAIAPWRDGLTATLRTELAACPGLWGFKDPRTARLLPLWKDVFAALDLRPRYVLALRDPRAVAASLTQRNGMTAAHGELLWLCHVADAIRHAGDDLVCISDYDRLVADPQSEGARVLGALGLPTAANDALSALIDPKLRHHADSTSEPSVLAWSAELHAALASNEHGGTPLPEALALVAQISSALNLLGGLDQRPGTNDPNSNDDWRSLRDSLSQITAEHSRLAVLLENRDGEIAALDDHLGEAKHHANDATGRAKASDERAERAELQANDATGRAKASDERAKASDERAAQSENARVHREREITVALHEFAGGEPYATAAGLRASTSWRITRPLRTTLSRLRRIPVGPEHAPTSIEEAAFTASRIRGSLSWKLTWPLRFARRKLGGEKGHTAAQLTPIDFPTVDVPAGPAPITLLDWGGDLPIPSQFAVAGPDALADQERELLEQLRLTDPWHADTAEQLQDRLASLTERPALAIALRVSQQTLATELQAAITSLRRQSYPAWHGLLVIEGEMSLLVEEVVQQSLTGEPRFSSIAPEVLAMELEQRRLNYVVPLNAADALSDNALLHVMTALESGPIEVICAGTALIADSGAPLAIRPASAIDTEIARQCDPYGLPVLLSRQVFEACGGLRILDSDKDRYAALLRQHLSAPNSLAIVPHALRLQRWAGPLDLTQAAAQAHAALLKPAIQEHLDAAALPVTLISAGRPGFWRLKPLLKDRPTAAIYLPGLRAGKLTDWIKKLPQNYDFNITLILAQDSDDTSEPPEGWQDILPSCRIVAAPDASGPGALSVISGLDIEPAVIAVISADLHQGSAEALNELFGQVLRPDVGICGGVIEHVPQDDLDQLVRHDAHPSPNCFAARPNLFTAAMAGKPTDWDDFMEQLVVHSQADGLACLTSPYADFNHVPG